MFWAKLVFLALLLLTVLARARELSSEVLPSKTVCFNCTICQFPDCNYSPAPPVPGYDPDRTPPPPLVLPPPPPPPPPSVKCPPTPVGCCSGYSPTGGYPPPTGRYPPPNTPYGYPYTYDNHSAPSPSPSLGFFLVMSMFLFSFTDMF